MESVHSTGLDAKVYRKIVTKALHKENENRLRLEAGKKDKCANILTEGYGKKTYLTDTRISDTRMHYRTRYRMLDFAGNYNKDKRFARTNWLCRCKVSKEDESHLLEGGCPVYGSIRRRYGSLDSEDDLVKFFSEVLNERERLEDEEKEEEERRRNQGGEVIAMDAASGRVNFPHASLGPYRPIN